MEKRKSAGLITTNESTLRPNLFSETPIRLTPTGKISHAKTRVYTQRYRKEWEQMADFKGWLTSVPFQPTRAFCTYCKKNLHAHRLSLLKHTCTMKHQRAALMHEAEEEKKAIVLKSDPRADLEEEEGIYDAADNTRAEGEENDDEVEYVVERLEMDEDEMEAAAKEQIEVVDENVEDGEEEEEDEAVQMMQSDEEDIKPMTKKIKVETVDSCRDTLAEAMAHVHGEYLEEEAEDQENVQMEMVVESEDQSNTEMQEISMLQDSEDGEKEASKEVHKNGRSSRRGDSKIEKKSSTKSVQEDSKTQADPGIVVALPLLSTAYQINSPAVPTSGTIGLLQPINALPIAPAQSKTITLTTGGKTLTLTGGTFQPGSQYVLSKLKGSKLPTLVMTEKKSDVEQNQTATSPRADVIKVSQDPLILPSTSRQSGNKHVLLKPIKPATKKPRISTHVVDTSKGLPIGGLQVSLYKLMDGRWTFLNESTTNANGRCTDLVDNMKVNFTAGRYKIHFDVDKYFTLRRIETMYPFIEIVFDVKNPAGQYHIPILLSPFGYTTYRGSER